MKEQVIICDICYGEGTLRLASNKYSPDTANTYHACPTHAKEVRGYGFEVRGLPEQTSPPE